MAMKLIRAAFLLAAITLAGCSAATTATPQPVEQPSQSCTVRQPDPTFTTIKTENALTRPHRVVAVADWNGDGLDDLVAFPWVEHSNDPADRHQTDPLAILLAQPDATFSRLLAPGLTVEARDPIVLVEDFNQDGTPDMAVFDAGVYATAESTGYGNPPQLLLSRPDFTHELSSALADAVAAHRHSLGPDLHLKSATIGDIDQDGDLDIWVESTGGQNVESHFLVNDGSSGFSSAYQMDENLKTNRNRGELWRYDGAELVDLDRDGDLDLVLGQIRDTHPTHLNQHSIVLENEGTGDFGRRYLLPHPDWFGGYTSVPHLTHQDLNGDGLQDLILVHQRNDGTDLPGEPFTGRHVQVLINQGGMEFEDETVSWMGDQSATHIQVDLAGGPQMVKFDRDECADLVVSGSRHDYPFVYRRVGDSFKLQDRPLTTNNGYAADVNGDGAVDFVSLPGGTDVEVLLNRQ